MSVLRTERLIGKGTLLLILIYIVNFAFEFTGQIFGIIVGAGKLFLTNWSIRSDVTPEQRERHFALIRRVANGFAALSLAPVVLKWSIQLSIVATLVGPFFDEVASALPSQVRFGTILSQAAHLHLASALAAMKQALFG
jgi:hypothetical protein